MTVFRRSTEFGLKSITILLALFLVGEFGLRISPISRHFQSRLTSVSVQTRNQVDEELGFAPLWNDELGRYSEQGIFLPTSGARDGKFLAFGNERTREGEWLRELETATGIQWSNAATEGYTIQQQIIYIHRHLGINRPNKLVWFVRPEDLVLRPRILASQFGSHAIITHGFSAPISIRLSWVRLSFLYSFFWETVFQKLEHRGNVLEQIHQEAVALDGFIRRTEFDGIRKFIVFIRSPLNTDEFRPWRYREAERQLSRIALLHRKGPTKILDCRKESTHSPTLETCLSAISHTMASKPR